MNVLSKRILFFSFFTIFLGITTSFSQSENKKINQLIEQKREFNKTNKNSIVYKIQLYNGNESQAYKIKYNFNVSFPEYNVKIIYKAPEWKTQVGNFKTRLEADRALLKIKEKFSSAIVLEDKI
ncbi:SPOR domain-containing protein [Lutibacter sp. B1]|uniref:SPOR domain-containing protein n=1 Tax=Lutibacter sp. B1 TaxID=2725996 RepID=UPI0014567B9C|nr:SPOR domain-containing protein [Lutibacter sp. B1]NLP57472.1 SPOR domain-containing protein [Lutibacter sp. B1]